MKHSTLFTFLIFTGLYTYGQNLIGFTGKEIFKYMNENYREMNYSQVTNTSYSYLKYSDNTDSETILFFLNSDSTCKSMRIVCDLSVKSRKIKEFNSIYKPSGENRWIDRRGNKDYLVEIRDEKWSCIVLIVPVK